MEPVVHIFEMAISSRLPGNAVDYFHRSSEQKENKKCMYVYIYLQVYLHTKDKQSLKL